MLWKLSKGEMALTNLKKFANILFHSSWFVTLSYTVAHTLMPAAKSYICSHETITGMGVLGAIVLAYFKESPLTKQP